MAQKPKKNVKPVESSPLSPQRLEQILARQVALYPAITFDELVRVTVLQVCRPGQLGEHLNAALRLRLIENLKAKYQKSFEQSGPARLCHVLANNVTGELKKVLPNSLSARAAIAPQNKSLQIQKHIQSQIHRNDWDATDVDRVATEIFKKQKKSRQGMRRLRLKPNDPLRSIWGLSDDQGLDLPVSDVRHRLLDTFSHVKNPQGESLAQTLREAAVFKPEVLRSVLGDYWSKGRPVGFVDRAKTVVLIRVANSADAQELSFAQREIINRLKELPGFAQLKKVRFEVIS